MKDAQLTIFCFTARKASSFQTQYTNEGLIRALHCRHEVVSNLRDFGRDEDGIATVWSVFWLVICIAIAGLAVDVTNAYKTRQILQTTADIAAHAGSLELGAVGSSAVIAAVRQSANEFAAINMRADRYGDVLVDSDILIGTWDHEARAFEETEFGSTIAPNSVRVTTRQSGGASSKVGTYFLRFAGFDSFEITATATVQRFVSQCERDGIISSGEVHFSTQQEFLNSFCIHGEGSIAFAQNNRFEAGTVASTPDLENCGPSDTSCTDKHNPGIEDALRAGTYRNGKVAKIGTYFTELQNQYSSYQPSYVDSSKPVIYTDPDNFDASALQTGRVYVVQCTSGESLSLGSSSIGTNNGNGNGNSGGSPSSGTVLKSQFVLVGIDCNLVFDDSIHYEDATFATSATGNNTISGSSGVVLGRDDDCMQGGEVVAITAGSVHFAAKMEAYDVEFIIKDDLHLASNANAKSVHSGSNFYVGGDVRITTKHTFSGCAGSTIPAFDPKYSWRITG